MPKLALVQRGIHCLRPQSASKPHLPVTPDILRQLKALCTGQATDFNIIMLWAACCTAFFSIFRMGELTSPTVINQGPVDCVSIGDVAVDDHNNPSLVRIHLRKSKTDQLGKGVDIYLGRTDEDLCLVAALLAYLAVWGKEPGPLFRLSDGCLLTKQIFIDKALSVLGV